MERGVGRRTQGQAGESQNAIYSNSTRRHENAELLLASVVDEARTADAVFEGHEMSINALDLSGDGSSGGGLEEFLI